MGWLMVLEGFPPWQERHRQSVWQQIAETETEWQGNIPPRSYPTNLLLWDNTPPPARSYLTNLLLHAKPHLLMFPRLSQIVPPAED